jgi:predicted Na+-dependent transporter
MAVFLSTLSNIVGVFITQATTGVFAGASATNGPVQTPKVLLKLPAAVDSYGYVPLRGS